MGVIPYSPLAGGWLSGRYRKDTDAQGPSSAARPRARFDMSDPANQRKLEAADALAKLADDAGITLIEPCARVRPAPPRGHRPAHHGPP